MMDSMAHENFMATVHLHTLGGQRLLTEEYNRTFKGQEDRGAALGEMKHLCVAEVGGCSWASDTGPVKAHPQKRSEKTLSHYTRLISEGLPLQVSSLQGWERWLFFSICNFSQKLTKHRKKQGNMTHSQEHNKSLESDTKETQASDLLDELLKTTA